MSTLGIISRGKLGSARLAAAPGINVARIGGPMAGWCSYVKRSATSLHIRSPSSPGRPAQRIERNADFLQ
jgi:hypothetical protein